MESSKSPKRSPERQHHHRHNSQTKRDKSAKVDGAVADSNFLANEKHHKKNRKEKRK
jgi:hypothetical protein